ncbi:hypothetical protein NIES4071_05590 [Calothrix sp. NIES-4071]|nr:hypothetical protein NIES4071_05590 [Calothrix sp. NIES-4071]BAZ54904.1 hypothetical protein NIES4105_05580 [Calothrix sp. NIES-4105]
MANKPPPIDTRAARDIVKQLQFFLKEYAPDWQEFELDPIRGETYPQRISAALIGVFARYAEIIIQRLNEVPYKNFLAFLNLLGASQLPPQSARVPLTFWLSSGSTVDSIVSAGTQVAALPLDGETEPVIFETERDLVVTSAKLESVFVCNPESDTYGDYSKLTEPDLPVPNSIVGDKGIFQGIPIEHIFYLGDNLLLSLPQIKNLKLTFNLASSSILEDSRQLEWQFWDGSNWQKYEDAAINDQTQSLRVSGSITLSGINSFIPTSQNRYLLRCCLKTPITKSSQPQNNSQSQNKMVRSNQLPQINQIQMTVTLERLLSAGLPPESVLVNSAAIEFNQDFFPFGEQPQLNDAFYLANSEAFSKDSLGIPDTAPDTAGASIKLDIMIANSHGKAANSVRPSDNLQLAWECWNGTNWQRLGISTAPSWLSLIEVDPPPPVQGNSLVVQGTIRQGASLTVKLEPNNNQQEVVYEQIFINEQSRFSVEASSLQQGINIIKYIAGYRGETTTTWTVIFSGREEQIILVVSAPELSFDNITSSPQTSLIVDATNDSDRAAIQSIRITNGRLVNHQSITENRGASIIVPLAEGRNDLLIEGLGASNTLNSATTSHTPPNSATTFTICREANREPEPQPDSQGFADGTYGLCQSGTVTLKLPDKVGKITLSGQENYWLRLRLIAGDYGKAANYRFLNNLLPSAFYSLFIDTFRPPIISQIKIGYSQELTKTPSDCFGYNNQTYTEAKIVNGSIQNFQPFVAISEENPTIYFGFTLPELRSNFPNQTLSIFCRHADLQYNPHNSQDNSNSSTNTANQDNEKVKLTWEYWDGNNWATLTVRDETKNLTTTGLIEFIPPADFSQKKEQDALFNLPNRYWLRVRWEKDKEKGKEKGKYDVAPILWRLLLNTTIADQAFTIINETLGSSNGTQNQTFRTTQTPVLSGQSLEVRESEMLTDQEKDSIEELEGKDAISIIYDTSGRPEEIWVRWHQVPDFYGSKPRDRHYVLEPISGEIRFGDGLNGMIPPVGINNLRINKYRTGGGTIGNRASNTIVQLKTTIPYIDRVTNPEAAAGGADAETIDSVTQRAPRTVRHGGRAVTYEDFEDLAMLATPEVARAKCIPLLNLQANPLDIQNPQYPKAPGEVSIIIVPRSRDIQPLPSLELINRVQDYLEKYAIATANICVVGPLYVEVKVTVDIVPTSIEKASTVEQAIYQTLTRFLHPLTGGLDGNGWAFGRHPHKSDFYALLEAVPGVDYIANLLVEPDEDESSPELNTKRFLVFSGKHKINLVSNST